MRSVVWPLLMCLSQIADSDCRTRDSTQQVNSTRETLYGDPEGNYCRPAFVRGSLCVGVNARLSLCTVEGFFTRLHDYHHFLHLSGVAFL